MKSGAKNGIDHNVGLIDQHFQLIARGTDAHVHITASSAAGNMASEGGRNLIRLNRRDDIHINALMRQDIRGDPAVSAIVAKANQHKNAIGIEL